MNADALADSKPKMDLIGSSRYALAANGLTISRLLFAPFFALLIVDKNPSWLTFAIGWILGATDLFDGKLARHATPTKFGAFFDPLADKAVVLLAGFALVRVDRFALVPIVLIAAREFAIQAYRSYWSREGLAIPARQSAKYKVFVQGIAIAAATCPLLEDWPAVADILLWIAVAFTLVSGAQYILDGRGALRTTGQR